MPARTVLVTNGTGSSGLAAAKSLALAGYEVATVDFCRLPLGLGSRYSRSHYVVTGLNQPDFERDLLDLVRSIRPDVFMPLGTGFVFFAAKNLDQLSAATAVSVPRLDAFMAAYVKSVCMAECSKLGIACPVEYSYREALEVLDHDRDETVVVKPDFDAGAATGVRFVRNRESLRKAVSECGERFGRTLIQQYIPGGPEAMKTVILLFSPESRLAAAFTSRKTRQWPVTGGQTAASLSTNEECLVSQVLPFFEKWQWRGSAEVELKFDSRDGLHKVIEINPRFPGYLRFPGQCGLDFPLLATQLALHNDAVSPSAYPAYRTGAKYLNPGLFLRAVVGGLQCRGVSELRHVLRDMRGTRSLVLEMLADPLALLGKVLIELRRAPDNQQLFYSDR